MLATKSLMLAGVLFVCIAAGMKKVDNWLGN